MTSHSQSDNFGQVFSTKSRSANEQAAVPQPSQKAKRKEGKLTAFSAESRSPLQSTVFPNPASLVILGPTHGDSQGGVQPGEPKLASSDAKGLDVLAPQGTGSSTHLDGTSTANGANEIQGEDVPQTGTTGDDAPTLVKMLSPGVDAGDGSSAESKVPDHSGHSSTQMQGLSVAPQVEGSRPESASAVSQSVQVPDLETQPVSISSSKLGAEISGAPGPESNQASPLNGDAIKAGSSVKDRSSLAEARAKRKPDGIGGDIASAPKDLERPTEKLAVEYPQEGREDAKSHPENTSSLVQLIPQSDDATNKGAKTFEAQQTITNSGTSTSSTSPQTSPSGSLALEAKSALSSAQLIQSMHHSEMRLGLNSSEFGNVSISTSLTHQSLSAQISTEHLELGRALAMHLPAMEEKLGNTYGLQTRVELNGGGAASSGDSDRGSAQHSGSEASPPASPSSSASVFPQARGVTASAARLDIRI